MATGGPGGGGGNVVCCPLPPPAPPAIARWLAVCPRANGSRTSARAASSAARGRPERERGRARGRRLRRGPQREQRRPPPPQIADLWKQRQLPFSVAFQSRLGAGEWIKPYLESEVEKLAKQGVKKLLVICPSFVSDCLETLEEVGMSIRQTFLDAGGETFTLVPCLNDDDLWVKNLAKLVSDEKVGREGI